MKSRGLAFFATIILTFIVGCGSGEKNSDSGQKAYTIAVIPKGTTHEFWKSIHAGAVKAQQELKAKGINVDLIWKGPLKEDDREQQIQVVENFIGRRVDGIVLAPLDAEALVAPVEAAEQANIPVVIIDSDLNTQKRTAYVATDNYKGGVLAAEHMGQLLGGKGQVILLRYQSGSASTEAREAGFTTTMKEKFPGIEFISSEQHAGATRETAYQASQNLLNRFGHEVKGVFTPNESSTVGMLLALRDIGRAGGSIKFIGFDVSSQLLEAMRAGDVQGLVIQNPMRMGYDGVITVMNQLTGKPFEKKVDTGVNLITPDNINDPTVQSLISPPIRDYLGDQG